MSTEPTEDQLQRICEAHYAGGADRDGVVFIERVQHDAINYTLIGECDETYFVVRDGDRGGTEVVRWGEGGAPYEIPPPPPPRVMVPSDRDLCVERPGMWRVYLAWREEQWLQEMERAYNYDRHFQPGCALEDHYRKKATARGLEPSTQDALDEMIERVRRSAS